MLKLFKILIFLLPLSAIANSYLDLDNSPLAESRIKLRQNHFNIIIKNTSNFDLKAILDKHSFTWLRYKKTLLLPQARLKLKIGDISNNYYVQYKSKVITFQQSKNASYTELNTSLFENIPILIKNKDSVIAEINIRFSEKAKAFELQDYTCSRNNISIKGLENEHVSIGCHTKRIGSFGNERPMLELKWFSPELEILGNTNIPFQTAFLNKYATNITVRNIYTNQIKTITISAKIPKRLHRLFTAYGFGPYAFETSITTKEGKPLSKSEPSVPALFFYLNYKISETTSIRGFDAAIWKESSFNNAGIYLGNDFGFALDDKLYFTTLLGVQYLYFKFDEDSKAISEPIFPQGIEFMYRHAFDIPNYIISAGVFFSTSESIEYENVWVRWGKNYFWELNFIHWAKDDFEAKMGGISVGFPFKGFL